MLDFRLALRPRRATPVVTLATVLSLVTTDVQPAGLRQPGRSPLYSARQSGTVVQLNDSGNETAVSIIPTLGNLTVEMKVKGHNVLRFPFESAADYKGGAGSIGIPFLAPWADRLDEQAFYANGKRYAFDMTLGNVRGANPIHGFLASASEWNVVEARADGQSAWVTSRLEFFRHPLWMKQFPFAHTIEMTHRLRDGVLEVATRIDNLSVDPMPVAIGFHPFFQLTDSPRDEWVLSVGGQNALAGGGNKDADGRDATDRQVLCKPRGRSAGAARPRRCVQRPRPRMRSGQATMSLRGKTQRLDVVLGANYRAVVIYAPKPAPGQDAAARNFVCIEPVAGIINALNLAHKGVYKELQSIPPAGVWQESFWIRPRRFLGVSRRPLPSCFRSDCSPASRTRNCPGEITFDDIARPKPGEWPSYNGLLSANRHSPLDRINTADVATLEPKWTHEMGGTARPSDDAARVDGVMYVAAVNEARALDARTGRQIWQFVRPQTPGLVPTGDPASGINRGDRRARQSRVSPDRSRSSARPRSTDRTASVGRRDGGLSSELRSDRRTAHRQRSGDRRHVGRRRGRARLSRCLPGFDR